MNGITIYPNPLETAPQVGSTLAMKHLTPKEAHDFIHAHPDAAFVDVRSEVEFLYVGHPVGADHIAWQDAPDWDVNPNFIREVKARTAGVLDRPVLLICRSGKRTLAAGEALEKAGFTHVANILHGFEGELDEQFHRGNISGWRHDGLPWQQM
jgi:rhodanese-related sulfurtransferase